MACPGRPLYYKAVTITPGGFFEFTTLHRDHFIGADIATPFGIIPYANTDTSHTDETRFDARRSRFILSTDADLDNGDPRQNVSRDRLPVGCANRDAHPKRFMEFALARALSEVRSSDSGTHLATVRCTP